MKLNKLNPCMLLRCLWCQLEAVVRARFLLLRQAQPFKALADGSGGTAGAPPVRCPGPSGEWV